MRRICLLRQEMERRHIGLFIVAGRENVRYVSGFTGSAGYAVVTADRGFVLTDFRYVEQAASEAPGFEVVRQGPDAAGALAALVTRLGVTRVGFEKEHISYAFYEKMAGRISGVELVGTEAVVESIRAVKEPEELLLIRKAAALADEGMAHAISCVRPGVRERELAVEVQHFLQMAGAERVGFEPIVVSGPRGSLPHGRPSERVIEPGDLVTIDLGAVFAGYCSDLTRTVAVGHASEKQREVHAVVLEAQEVAMEKLRPGIVAREVDAAARGVMGRWGYGEYFGHGLGHGVGLAVHEWPRVGMDSETVLQEGMVVTVEPGIYIPGWGGARIEDLVVTGRDGCEVISRARREFSIVP